MCAKYRTPSEFRQCPLPSTHLHAGASIMPPGSAPRSCTLVQKIILSIFLLRIWHCANQSRLMNPSVSSLKSSTKRTAIWAVGRFKLSLLRVRRLILVGIDFSQLLVLQCVQTHNIWIKAWIFLNYTPSDDDSCPPLPPHPTYNRNAPMINEIGACPGMML